MIIVAKIFAILGIVAYAAGCYLIFGVTALGNSPYWGTDFGGVLHVGTALAAIVFCIVAIAKARKKPGEAAAWLLASAVIWALGQMGHVSFISSQRPAPDSMTGFKNFFLGLGIFSSFTVPALIGALFAWLGSRKERAKASA